MENKNQTIIIALLTLILGLLVGYFLTSSTMMPHQNGFSDDVMHGAMGGHQYGDEIIDGDGAMMHAMDEMMLGFRGKTGEEYEEAFLRGMIVHHIGAVQMAEDMLKQTDRPELKAFAQDIIDTQSKEIDIMKTWLTAWFNEN